MSDLPERLLAICNQLDAISLDRRTLEPLEKLLESANEVSKAWCGSWIGYQSRVYYDDLLPIPPGAHFSVEWGFQQKFSNDSTGDWVEFTFDSVRATIFSRAGLKALEVQEKLAARAKELFEPAREDSLSIVSVALGNKADAFLSRLKDQIEKLRILEGFEYVQAIRPRGSFATRDWIAMGQGIQTPPHMTVIAEITAIKEAIKACGTLGSLIRRAASHLGVREQPPQIITPRGMKVFIGHGRSAAWKDLKNFLQDHLDLPWDEFNRVPVAGVTNITRLSEMLNEALMAFVVMTAEDEQSAGTIRARMNVVHEAGLFQGRLGFTKAIIVFEDGCEEFSNIAGLGQIRFPQGNIKAAFEDIRLVLERENVIPTNL